MTQTMKRVKYFIKDAEDKPGALAQFATTLKNAGVNLKGLWAFGMGGGKAQIICVPEDGVKFKNAAQAAGMQVREATCFFLAGEDRAGVLCEMLDKVSAAKINLHAVDAISTGNTYGAYVWAEDKDVEAVGKVLGV
ncbi:MAG: hypothetical protein HY399_08320 [Elusimicrobia bacterium]|nr:hypothetical protein [Elusimicrobiota bacterium]